MRSLRSHSARSAIGLCAVLLFATVACGGKKKMLAAGGGVSTGSHDGGAAGKKSRADAGVAGTGGTGGGTGVVRRDASTPRDAGPEPYDAFGYDAAGDYRDAAYMGDDAGPAPAAWTCPKALWNDGHCDCGCSAIDVDCEARGTSCSDPGCVAAICDACYTLSGSWKACVPDPSPSGWACTTTERSDGLCDCGCGVADEDCKGQGCSEPGCRKQKCDVRHGCSTAQSTHDDDCSSANPKVLTSGAWRCPWDRYASGDGCDCSCGAPDPDCAASTGGCTAGRCFDTACDRCNDEQGRPYACPAAQAGWDEDILGDATTQEPSQCLSKHFGTGDGCDCGCGGHDPDCGNAGCDLPGCEHNHPEYACDRCTDGSSRKVTGCDVPSAWTTDNKCKPENFGTGDGCDCGCGTPDPDCKGNGCTTAGCKDAACDVCNDGTGFFVQCPGWTCTDSAAFGTGECDCGCGVVDPFCRDTGRVSCTGAGCETAACQYCNDSGGVRGPCGGQWTSTATGGSQCNLPDYGLDGLCDCGCGAHDPDCNASTDCTDKGCLASGCDVCHDGTLFDVCFAWNCAATAFGTGDGCDCGCGAPDPDCSGAGCREPGCKDAACVVCHDPIGRAVPCP